MECSHFIAGEFDPKVVEISIRGTKESERLCHICKVETESRWVCLGCGVISCGRFEKGHSELHNKKTGHKLALDLITKSVHCYNCDEYVQAGKRESEVDLLRKIITDINAGLVGDDSNHTPLIESYFLDSVNSPMTPLAKNGRPIRSSLVEQLILIYEALSGLKSEQSVSPQEFYEFMQKKLPFGGYQQHDAQEFLRSLIDHIHCELEKAKGKTVIMKTFQGVFENHIVCGVCKAESIKEEPFLDLSLPILNVLKSENSLEKSIDAFISPEALTGDNSYSCQYCKKRVVATKTMKLKTLSPILTIHFKRFKFENGFRSKVTDLISFPLELDTSAYLKDGKVYILYGVILHRGTAGQGHYISYVKRNNEWYEINDSIVKKCSEQEVLKLPAYMLFYEIKSLKNSLVLQAPLARKKARQH